MPNRNVVVLGCGRDDLEESLELCLGRQRHGKEFDRRVVDIVVRRDHPEVERRQVHLVLDRNALARLEIRQRRLRT